MGRRATPGRKAAKMRRRKPKRSSAAATASQSNLSVRNLQERLKGQARELEGARDEHATLADVLRIISNSPGELEAVFQTILTNAVRICGAKLGDLYLREADGFRMAASHNAPPAYIEARTRSFIRFYQELPSVASRKEQYVTRIVSSAYCKMPVWTKLTFSNSCPCFRREIRSFTHIHRWTILSMSLTP